MHIRRFSTISAVLAASLMTAPLSASAAALPSLPSGYENFVPEIDYDAYLSDAMKVPGAVECTVTKTENVPAMYGAFVKEGTTLNLDGLGSNPLMMAGLGAIVATPDSLIQTTCPVSIELPGSQTFTGTVANPVLATAMGADAAEYTLDCAMSGTITATANVSIGDAAKNKFTMGIERAEQSIPLDCALSITFNSSPVSTLSGSVSGAVKVTASDDAVACQGSADPTCIPISLTDAVVKITNATGKLDGYTGTGTYTFTDLFSLESIDGKINAIKSAAKISSVRATRVGSTMVRTTAVGSESMTLNLGRKAAAPVIVHPNKAADATKATIAKNAKLTIAATKGAACVLTAKVGKKSTTVASIKKVASSGVWKPAFSQAVVKKVGAKAGKSSVAFTVSCKSGKKTLKSTKTAAYSG